MRLFIIALTLTASSVLAQVAVVVNPDSEVSAEKITDLLLGEMEGQYIIAFPDDEEFREKAVKKLLGISYEDLKILWLEKTLDGRGFPPLELPLEDLKKTIRTRKDVIGIIPYTDSGGLKVLKVLR